MRWPSISRRGLFRGAGIAAATGAVVGVLPGCTNPEQQDVPEPLVVDSDKAINVLEEYEEVDLELKETNSWNIPLGSVPHEGTGTWLPVTQTGSSASPMVRGCVLSTEKGEVVEVLHDVRGDNHNTVIFDARCSNEVYAWVELDYLTHEWTLYAASLDNGKLGSDAATLWQANADYDPPGFACVGKRVLWQVMPALGGTKTKEHSFCYLWKLGGDNAQAVVESPGRFAIAPCISGDVAVLVPRVRANEGVYYGVTAYAIDDDLATVVDQLVLPQTIKPFYAVYVGNRFAISIEASYSSGGMFGSMGTYIGPSDGPFVKVPREPSANVAGKGDQFIIKSRTSYFVVDVRKSTYSILTAVNRCVDYGEFPARVGESDDFVTFATVKDEQSGYPSSVTVRTFGW